MGASIDSKSIGTYLKMRGSLARFINEFPNKRLADYGIYTDIPITEDVELELAKTEMERLEKMIREYYAVDTPTNTPTDTPEVREAIMRLTMCAREECSLCKYADSCAFDKQVEMATENMNTILTAFTERPKGEWIMHIDDFFPPENTMECNQCHERQPLTIDDNFCPYCGADMRGEAK